MATRFIIHTNTEDSNQLYGDAHMEFVGWDYDHLLDDGETPQGVHVIDIESPTPAVIDRIEAALTADRCVISYRVED